MPFTFVVHVVAYVFSSIFPSEMALSVLLIVFPHSVILTPIHPLIDASTLHFVLDKVAVEGASIWPYEFAVAVFLSIAIVALKDSAVGPDFFAYAIVFVIDPVAIVVCSIDVRVLSTSI